MATVHNMKMELPHRPNRVQIKTQTTKSDTISETACGNNATPDLELVPNYSNNESDFIGIMEIKNEFAGNV